MSSVWTYLIVTKKDAKVAISKNCLAEISRGHLRLKNFNKTGLNDHLPNKCIIQSLFSVPLFTSDSEKIILVHHFF